MTEAQIESIVEKRFDRLDALLMRGAYTQAEYDHQAQLISKWADDMYAVATRER